MHKDKHFCNKQEVQELLKNFEPPELGFAIVSPRFDVPDRWNPESFTPYCDACRGEFYCKQHVILCGCSQIDPDSGKLLFDGSGHTGPDSRRPRVCNKLVHADCAKCFLVPRNFLPKQSLEKMGFTKEAVEDMSMRWVMQCIFCVMYRNSCSINKREFSRHGKPSAEELCTNLISRLRVAIPGIRTYVRGLLVNQEVVQELVTTVIYSNDVPDCRHWTDLFWKVVDYHWKNEMVPTEESLQITYCIPAKMGFIPDSRRVNCSLKKAVRDIIDVVLHTPLLAGPAFVQWDAHIEAAPG